MSNCNPHCDVRPIFFKSLATGQISFGLQANYMGIIVYLRWVKNGKLFYSGDIDQSAHMSAHDAFEHMRGWKNGEYEMVEFNGVMEGLNTKATVGNEVLI